MCSLTEVVGYELGILEGMLCADSHNGLVCAQRAIRGLARRDAPSHLLLEHMEQGHDIAETAGAFMLDILAQSKWARGVGETMVAPLQRHVAVSDRDHGNLELLGRGAKGQQQGQDIVNAWLGVSKNPARPAI
jgi:hypothetical protein